MNIVIVGHVDHGKSTVIGRLWRIPIRFRRASWNRYADAAATQNPLNTHFA